MEIIEIKWIDSKGISNYWEYKEDLESLRPAYCVSVGYLVERNWEYITIAQSDSKEQLTGRMTIPKKAVIKTRVIAKQSTYHDIDPK